ncbi:tRNA (adenosine(37)-N6)-threonylcarbamoyltransferase complex dimerization subunit type 1 TsaB [Roseibacillus ishigakijimensis]|uniref:tRNA (Adenosine(37)-N6)-threonylcarbamoyltransferase complex dimerization subunit type 1 TsaB n=1 Tax=Roseibacillus ishigakijimensis TaxID=454146 RepID=A0A934RRL7_9BACT|nr:tRNA (adenosine(37)-N6)-threonylcarbamoyltransferase complex dimerization subunit type 1 TsaB [Roseibacillus ishigakijimensis]MBK1833754.1 tRNA (adenosine(37)-N6)-threonylcarbamoyltransferase complex dimerization subunit type 1 TsaB [Roseibacillus ishigakijimensis]
MKILSSRSLREGEFAGAERVFQALLFFLGKVLYFATVNALPVLAIETSVATGSVALCSADKVWLDRCFTAGRKPSATLWEPLHEVIKEVSILQAVVVGVGPGSYNGSRIGIAAAQAIALAHDCPVIPLSSFEGVALESTEGWAIGDARRGSFSLQKIANGRLAGDFALVDGDELVRRVQEACDEGQEVFSFDEPARFPLSDPLRSRLQHRSSESKRLAKAYWQRTPAERAVLATQPAQPFYLRDPHITPGKRKSLMK